MRATWTHIAARASSGTPICRKIASEKNRSFIASPVAKLRARAPAFHGEAASHSAVAWALKSARSSHASQNPVMPAIQISGTSTQPEIHDHARQRPKWRRTVSRTMCSSVNATHASPLYRCSPRSSRPPGTPSSVSARPDS
jgi:hypothetical protein